MVPKFGLEGDVITVGMTRTSAAIKLAIASNIIVRPRP